MKWVVRCRGCYHLWKTSKNVGTIVICPMCGAENIVRILVYLMQREEARHRRLSKINLALSVFMVCILFWIVSLPPHLVTYIGISYFAALTFLLGSLAVFDRFQAKAIRLEIGRYNSRVHEDARPRKIKMH